MFDFNRYLRSLSLEMQKGLPGWDAQKLMSARGREKLTDDFILSKNPRKSSVLVWLFPKEGAVFTRLILRTQYEGVHSGQVSFPGGAMEETDPDLWHTALREAKEEIGLPPDRVSRIGELSPLYIPPSNFWVFPFVGYSDSAIPAEIANSEVQHAIDFNISTLLDPALKVEKNIKRSRGEELPTPGYNIEGHFVWGATAMMLGELEELLRRIGF